MNDFLEVLLSGKTTKLSEAFEKEGFGEQEDMKKVTEPQTYDKAEAEFADGDEVIVKDFEASAKDLKGVVLMNEDGKIMSYTSDGDTAFLDTVDDIDGGYKRAVKFDSFREANMFLQDKFEGDIPEDVITIKATEAFNFV